jgi:hypothetical protein
MASLAISLEPQRPNQSQPPESEYRIRPFPSEDIYFWTKRIDNSRVERRRDPRFLDRVWRMVTLALVVTIAGLGYAVPGAYRLLAGAEVEALRTQLAGMERQYKELALRYDGKRSPANLGKAPGKYIPANPRNDIHLPPVAGPRIAYRPPQAASVKN